MKLIDQALLDKTAGQARNNQRLRMNHNFHTSLDAPLHRLLNAMEPGSYIRPHRHLNPDREESCILLRGKVAVLLFDEEGNVTGHAILSPSDGVYGIDLEAGIWHSVIVLEPGSVIYEAKEGPYAPLTKENMAPWSPEPEESEKVKEYMERLMKHITI
ncbi:MAG: WbuC family cupin fold metalloprotein [Bacteroidales bacterium]|nr:WbuC family cupin fold metalloprotein [Bacteroidales bacterium]